MEYKSDFKRNRCKSCKKDFSIKAGTIFEDSNIPLKKWFMAMYIFNAHKKGISSVQLAKDISITQKSAWFIYLMKTCFNGLWRVNKKGQFNVPIGSYKNPNICNESNIYAACEALQEVQIIHQDFSKITPQKGDFVYFDPPYQPIKPDSFTKYISGGFGEKDQERLRDFALELKNKGVFVMISNSNADLIFDLYSKDFKIETVPAPRVVSCKASGRESVMETVVLGV